MSIQDNAIHLGIEGNYGTFQTPSRSFEGQGDGWKAERQYLDSVGFRSGIHTTRSDRRRSHTLGGEGALELDVMDKGLGMVLRGLFGGEAIAQIGATNAYEQTFESGQNPADVSYSAQMVRSLAEGGTAVFSHTGVVPTSFAIDQALDEILKLKIEYDLQDVVISEAEASPDYPADILPFDWADCAIEIDDVPVDMMSFSLEGELAMKTDRRFLRRSVLKKKPRRNAHPTYSGTLEAEFESLDRYLEFMAGTTHKLSASWVGEEIETGQNHSLTITLAEVMWEGETPEASLTEMTKQDLPFRVLHNGVDPAVSVSYVSTDIAH